MNLLTKRASGILLHISSLPGKGEMGDLGRESYQFVDFLSKAGQSYWQMLPVNPTGSGHSPYSSTSAFAGNPLFINLELLVEDKIIEPALLESSSGKEKILRQAAAQFQRQGSPELWDELRVFLTEESYWLDDYAWFSALKERFNGAPWSEWPEKFRARRFRTWEREALHFIGEASFYHQFCQFLFHRQWKNLAAYCQQKGISLIGDLPIFIAHDSADVWAHQEIFDLDKTGNSIAVAGVPPDYFSKTGQLWGNPLYRWDILKNSGYEWWVKRFEISGKRFNALRLDHFIGFCRYWRVPAGSKTAAEGAWTQGPGKDFFTKIISQFKDLQIIAEDLGVAGEDVYKLRDEFHFPGMNVLQFSFGGEERFLPKNYLKNSVAYTGTHDNDTLAGWIQESGSREEVKRALAYAQVADSDTDIHWKLIQAVMDSPANTAILPIQDALGLGSKARMNTPGTIVGNWTWRLRAEQLAEDIAERLKKISESTHRL